MRNKPFCMLRNWAKVLDVSFAKASEQGPRPPSRPPHLPLNTGFSLPSPHLPSPSTICTAVRVRCTLIRGHPSLLMLPTTRAAALMQSAPPLELGQRMRMAESMDIPATFKAPPSDRPD